MFRVCALEDFDLIITDDGLPEADRCAISDRGLALDAVNPDTSETKARELPACPD